MDLVRFLLLSASAVHAAVLMEPPGVVARSRGTVAHRLPKSPVAHKPLVMPKPASERTVSAIKSPMLVVRTAEFELETVQIALALLITRPPPSLDSSRATASSSGGKQER